MAATSSAVAVDALPRWKVLFLGMLKPGTYMRLEESSLPGVSHFYRTFSIYCMLPVVLLNVVAIIAQAQSPEVWHFQDITPWTAVIAVPAQLIVGPLNIWLIAWCMYGGMNVLGLNPAGVKERALTTGWYVGTTLLCLGYWWIGFGVFFGSIRAIWRSVDSALTIGLVAGIAIWIWVAWSAYMANLPEPAAGKGAKVFFGLIVGVLFFFLAMIPIGFVLQLVVVAIVRGM
jgi:hypothetical protein